MMYGYGYGMIIWFVSLIFISLVVVWLVLRFTNHTSRSMGKTPLNILKERYAKGEINKEEFEQKKRDLS